MESPDGASCSQNNGANREGEGFPTENVIPIILANGSNDVAAAVSRSETISTDILGLPSAVAQFLAPETLGTQLILELKENEEGGRSIQIRKQENKKRKLTDYNQVSECSCCANCELPPSQKVVWMDHILEGILDYLDVSDLLQCRLVSHRFKAFAGSLLRNRIQLEFVDLNLHDHKSGKLLSELTALLKNEHMDLPCSNIQFVEAKEYLKWGNESLQEFFDIFGSKMEKLSFVSRMEKISMPPYPWHVWGRQSRCESKHVQEEWVKGIKRLLLDDARNLQYLSIQMAFPQNKEPQRCHFPDSGLFFIETDEGFRQVEEKCKKISHKRLNPNLKILRMGGVYDGVPLKLLETIIQLSPNLQEVLIDHHNYMPLVRPLNRLHLLKTIEIKLSNYYGLNAVKKVLDFVKIYDLSSNHKSLQLRHLKLFLELRNDGSGMEKYQEYINAMNQLLAYTCDSLECFSWTVGERVNLDKVKIKFPSVLPNVKKVVLKSVQNTPGPFFPLRFKFPEMFPNLRELVLLASDQFEGMKAFTERLDFKSHFQGDVTMGTVRRVQIEGRRRELARPMFRKSSTLFKAWFPNAELIYKVIVEDEGSQQQDPQTLISEIIAYTKSLR